MAFFLIDPRIGVLIFQIHHCKEQAIDNNCINLSYFDEYPQHLSTSVFESCCISRHILECMWNMLPCGTVCGHAPVHFPFFCSSGKSFGCRHRGSVLFSALTSPIAPLSPTLMSSSLAGYIFPLNKWRNAGAYFVNLEREGFQSSIDVIDREACWKASEVHRLPQNPAVGSLGLLQ